MSFGHNKKARSLKTIIEDTADSSAVSSIFLFQLVDKAWNEVVGPIIARNSTVKKIDNGVLKISAESAPVRNEILMRKNSIKTAINNKLNKEIIKAIIFV